MSDRGIEISDLAERVDAVELVTRRHDTHLEDLDAAVSALRERMASVATHADVAAVRGDFAPVLRRTLATQALAWLTTLGVAAIVVLLVLRSLGRA